MIERSVHASFRNSAIPGRLLAAALLVLALCLGCAGPGLPQSRIFGPARSPARSTEQRAAVAGELPPKEAARACMVTAQELQAEGHPDQAIVLYEKARRYDPSLKSVSHRLAGLYDARGDSTRSLTEYQKALKLDPNDPNLLSDFGYYWWERKNLEEAEQWLRKALKIEPEHHKALSNLGIVLADQGRYEESVAVFSKVVGRHAAYSNVGVLLAKQGRYDQAKSAFREALAGDPTLPQAKAFLQYLDARG